ncbi:hypothetical protein BpHYR1_028206 [Brachionus plicatilis]|uniref:Uncharacterized protein n=1 Tax=Brachionus plicatilis TaxID=10195 RepID=A0A3M7P833_BRAPC|nr:hypothetical protein BpHYR1_028206 [Brachionus plicatilis]
MLFCCFCRILNLNRLVIFPYIDKDKSSPGYARARSWSNASIEICRVPNIILKTSSFRIFVVFRCLINQRIKV